MRENPEYPLGTRCEQAAVTIRRCVARQGATPANPQETVRSDGILRDHTPALSISERKVWSEPCGDVGRLAETTSSPPRSRALGGLISNRRERNSLSGKFRPARMA